MDSDDVKLKPENKSLYIVISFLRNIQKKQMYGGRKWIGDGEQKPRETEGVLPRP